MPKFRRDVQPLLERAIDSLTLGIEVFNRPIETGRTHVVPMLLHHAFELILKAVILQRGSKIHDKTSRYTFGFDRCLAIADEELKVLSKDERATLSILDARTSEAETLARAWLKKNRVTKAGGASDHAIDAKASTALWDIVFDLDEYDETDLVLINQIKNQCLNWDHHAGILMVRAKGGGPLTAATEDKELWTFSADGGPATPGPAIIRKKFVDGVLTHKAAYLGIWRLNDLAPGGFAPESFSENEGNISIDLPPRFIHWQ